MFLVRLPTQSDQGAAVLKTPLSSQPPPRGQGQELKSPRALSPPLPHLIICRRFSPSRYGFVFVRLVFFFFSLRPSCRSTPLSQSSLLFLASKLFLIPSYTWNGGGEAVSYFKKKLKLQPLQWYCIFLLTYNREQLFPRCKIPPTLKNSVNLNGMLILTWKVQTSYNSIFKWCICSARLFGHLKSNDLIPPAKIPEVKTRHLELVYLKSPYFL